MSITESPLQAEGSAAGQTAPAVPPKYVFISHSHADAARADDVKTLVEYFQNVSVYLSSRDHTPGPLSEKVKQQLKRADTVIGLLTDMAVKSTWVSGELGAAWILDKTIILIGSIEKDQLPGPVDYYYYTRIGAEPADFCVMIEEIFGVPRGGNPRRADVTRSAQRVLNPDPAPSRIRRPLVAAIGIAMAAGIAGFAIKGWRLQPPPVSSGPPAPKPVPTAVESHPVSAPPPEAPGAPPPRVGVGRPNKHGKPEQASGAPAPTESQPARPTTQPGAAASMVAPESSVAPAEPSPSPPPAPAPPPKQGYASVTDNSVPKTTAPSAATDRGDQERGGDGIPQKTTRPPSPHGSWPTVPQRTP